MRGRFGSRNTRKATKGAKCLRGLCFFQALRHPEVLLDTMRVTARCEPLKGMRVPRIQWFLQFVRYEKMGYNGSEKRPPEVSHEREDERVNR